MVFSLKSGLIPVFLILIKGTTSIQLFKPQTSAIPLLPFNIQSMSLVDFPSYILIYLLLAFSPKLTYYYFSSVLQQPPKFIYLPLLWPYINHYSRYSQKNLFKIQIYGILVKTFQWFPTTLTKSNTKQAKIP